MKSTIGFLFPGQGSQSVGMGKSLYETNSKISALYQDAQNILGYDVGSLCFDGPAEQLNQTEFTQPALLVTSVAVFQLVQDGPLVPSAVAGHSLGEYTALVAAGAIQFREAVGLVQKRGKYMAEAVHPGSGLVAAVLGLSESDVCEVCKEAAVLGIVAPANLNSPGQTVIAGERVAVEQALELAKARGAKRVKALPVSVPVHTPLMQVAADRLKQDIDSLEWSDLQVPLINNVDAKALWKKVTHNAWRSAEPGVLFWDTVINESIPDRYADLGFKTISTNPCGEIILQPKQFCNLTEVVARSNDTEKSLLRKVRLAAILGTYQASLSNFSYISEEWKKNIEDERLLGVSITGVWDSKAARDPKVLQKLRTEVNKVNKQYAKKLGINSATATTSVKPSGTLSSVVNSSSGMHARHAPYYVRRVRITTTDSLFKMLKDQGVPAYPEVGQTAETAHTWVLEFPVKAPAHSTFSSDLSAIEQLEHWKKVKVNYTEHNPSVTVSIGDDEWIGVADWVYDNWEIVGGLSFLPRNDHVYQLAPFEEITKEEFERREKEVAHIDFSKLPLYELKDETDVKKELACAGGTCEIEI